MIPKCYESVERQIEACSLFYANTGDTVKDALSELLTKLHECTRSAAKRCRERRAEEALRLLKRLPARQLRSLDAAALRPLVQLLLCMQLESARASTACRTLDQMIRLLAEVHRALVFDEVQRCFEVVMASNQFFHTCRCVCVCVCGLSTVCMFLEDSTVGHEVVRRVSPAVLCRVADVFSSIMEQEALKNGDLCYTAVKVCLQMFQLLPAEVAPLVWEEGSGGSPLQDILMYLMDVVLGESSNRDTRLLAGTAVVMLINTARMARDGATAAWSVLQVAQEDSWQLCVGELRAECRPRRRDGVGRLSISRGLLTCCRKDILVCCLDCRERSLLLEGLFPIISALCEENLDCHYYVFQALALLLKCIKECLNDLWDARGAPLLKEDSSLCQQLIQVIWNNAESPVEGVAEFVRSSFRFLLDIYQLEHQHFQGRQKQLYFLLLNRIIALPWEAKVKYFPLCALLPYVGTNTVFQQFPELPNHLLKCLSTNHLSPCASEAYKSLVQQQRQELSEDPAHGGAPPSEQDMALQWAQRWQPALLEALTSNVALLQSNASSYLLPWTLRTFPAAFSLLQASLTLPTAGHVRAWACLMSVQRAVSGLWPVEDGSSWQTLQLALSSLDDSVRLAALNLICCSPKTREPPTLTEFSVLRQFLPLNLNSESSPFRQQLQAVVKKFLVRVRDSCLACLRDGSRASRECVAQGMETDSTLSQGVGFVDWLAQLPFSSLAPGYSYQRKKTALLLLATVLETCTDTWSPDKKKGQPPANISVLINWARHRGQWDFFSRPKLMVLICCLEDGTNEIRDLAAGLLLKFFPLDVPEDLVAALLERAHKLRCSPRVPEAQTGAVLTKVLLQNGQEVSTGAAVGHLLQELELHYLTAQSDMLLAARTTPIHGVLSALQRCMLDGPQQGAPLSQSEMGAVLNLLEKITLLLLGILYGGMAGGSEEQETSPSFCAMGNAIRSLIAQGGGQGVGEGDDCVLLSEEHSLVLTCCWVSFKEIGVFLGGLVEKIVELAPPAGYILTIDDLKRAAKIFRDILLKCRHWGAVEGCCAGFTRFCAALLRSQDPRHREIPALMLKQGLSVLQSPHTVSVTRRAAGLPMLVLSIVAAEEASKARPLLALSMQTLMNTAHSPLPEGWDQTLDLPQVCAVHVLQAVVRGSGLGVAVLQYAASVTILSLKLLSSPCWAMRNAALQLYNSLCSRMLGPCSGGQDRSTQHGMSPPAFFNHYPTLQPFLLVELQRAAGEILGSSGEARLRLYPSLFPVLTLLAKLQPGVNEETQFGSSFQMCLLQLAGSPIFNVRVMASKALLAMTPPAEYLNIVLELARGIQGPEDSCCHNLLHGQLLQMRALLARALNVPSKDQKVLHQVTEHLETSKWLATSAQRCPLIRSAYLEVVMLVARFCSHDFLDSLQTELLHQLQSDTQEHQFSQVGSGCFSENAVRFICEEAMRFEGSQYARKLWEDLAAEGADVQLALVKWVVEDDRWRGTRLHCVLQKVLQANLKVALLGRSVEYRKMYLAALVAAMTPGDVQQPCTATPPIQMTSVELVELLLGILEGGAWGPELLSQALRVLSLLLLPLGAESLLTDRWCCLLEAHRTPEAPEVLRLACAQALRLAGIPFLSPCPQRRSADSVLCVRLINTGIFLLKDEDQQVRTEVAGFASALTRAWRGGVGHCFQMQVNHCLLFLLNLLLEEFWESPHTLETLLCHLPGADLGAVLRDAQHAEQCCLYEKDDAVVFTEPAAMSECVLPFLLKLVEKVPESTQLGDSVAHWIRENAKAVLENIALCRTLNPGDSSSWLNLLIEPRFHWALCGLFTRAVFLLRLLENMKDLTTPCDQQALCADVQVAQKLLSSNGVLLPSAIAAAINSEQPPLFEKSGKAGQQWGGPLTRAEQSAVPDFYSHLNGALQKPLYQMENGSRKRDAAQRLTGTNKRYHAKGATHCRVGGREALGPREGAASGRAPVPAGAVVYQSASASTSRGDSAAVQCD
ncbi:thyroid adenoma-associated protein homolog [Arapaima gigas]